MIKKALINTIIISTGLLTTSAVLADAKFRPRVDFGLATYNLDIDYTDGTSQSLDSTYLKLGVGGTIINGRWYFDLGYSSSINAESDVDQTLYDFSRSDLTLTAGYVFTNNVTVFGGYKSGKSEFTSTLDDVEFNADGIYAGAGVNIPTSGNVFSLNAAIALLDGELTVNNKDVTDPPTGTSSDTADTVGLSLGAGYNIPLSNNSGLALKANYQVYDFDGYSNPAFELNTTTESILAFDVGYYATF